MPAAEHFEVRRDTEDFYGQSYWLDYQKARDFPDIRERARADLSERCVYWLRRLLEVVGPPGRALEIGCGHGGFVRLLTELGFDAVGTELSPWVVDFARRTFGVTVLRGALEELDLASGFRCIAAFDVIEHVRDPAGFGRRCGELLADDGVLLLQTPWYRGEGPDWSMFQENEHVFLFTDASMRRVLESAGFRDVAITPSLFPYDMWVTASRTRLGPRELGQGIPTAFRAVLGLAASLDDTRRSLDDTRRSLDDTCRSLDDTRRSLAEADADRAARLRQVEELTALLKESEADRAARLEVIHALERRLAEIESTLTWRVYRAVRPRGGR